MFLSLLIQGQRCTNSIKMFVFQMVDHLMGGIEDITGHVGHNLIREKYAYCYITFITVDTLRNLDNCQ